MKKSLFVLLFISSLSVSSQIPKEAFDLSNSLYKLIDNDSIEKAIKSTIRLNSLYESMFVKRMHHTISQGILREKGVGSSNKYLNGLYEKNNDTVNQIISPLYLWSKSFVVSNNVNTNDLLETFLTKLNDSTNYKSKTELYGLLIIKNLDDKKLGSLDLKDKVFDKINDNLKKYPHLNESTNVREVDEERAWSRFLLAYCYNYLYDKLTKDFSVVSKEKEQLLDQNLKVQFPKDLEKERGALIANAARYSPDQIDNKRKNAYFYDAALINGNPNKTSYKNKYADFLNKKGDKKMAFNVLLHEAYTKPTNNNIKKLKKQYLELEEKQTLKTIWYDYINTQMEDVPDVKVQFETELLNLTKKHDYWIYIDVWGTWCGPCLKELPELNKVAEECNKDSDSNIKVYTFSYRSQKLNEFMDKNNYTFPVAEIDKNVNDLFKVSGYPTKILISPESKYLKIPFGVNWEQYLKNYHLIE
ncbi:MAG: TlpA disulfide reductase family protein [Algibacter sp.]